MSMSSFTRVQQVTPGRWSSDSQTIDPSDGVVQLASADPDRHSTTVYTDPDESVGILFIVPGSGQARGGIRIIPGAGFNFAHGAAIYGYCTGGSVLVNTVTESGAVC